MDGRFVPNLTIGPVVVEAVRRATAKPIDVHLMIVEPERYIEDFARAGADHLLVHCEPSATIHLHRTLSQIRDLGKTAGAVLNPATPLTLDRACARSVRHRPDHDRQPRLWRPEIPALDAAENPRACGACATSAGSTTIIEVDGGIGGGNAWQVIEAGRRGDRRRLGGVRRARLRRGDRRDPQFHAHPAMLSRNDRPARA